MVGLDPVIHQPNRLRIMAALVAVDASAAFDFRSLAKTLDLTDGNLGAHLMTLEEAGYVRIEKSFVDRKPKTHVSATSKGRRAFAAHVEALEEILGSRTRKPRR